MKQFIISVLISRNLATALLSCAFALTGCADAKLHSDITEFDKSIQALEPPIRAFYTKANDMHRDLYLDEVKMTPGMPLTPELPPPTFPKADTYNVLARCIQDEDDKGSPHYLTGLTAYYSNDYVKVRILAVRALAKYSGKLNELATSTEPSQAQQSINKLGSDLKDLDTQLNAIESAHHKNKNLDVASFSTPIANLIALGAGNYLEWLRDKWLKKNLAATHNDVATLCTALEDDLNLTAQRVKSRATLDLAVHEQGFNNSGALLNGSSSSSDRTQYLTDTAKIGKDQDDMDQVNPADLVKKVRLLHERIINEIGPRKPQKIKNVHSDKAGENHA
jgi:hypothetical protein